MGQSKKRAAEERKAAAEPEGKPVAESASRPDERPVAYLYTMPEDQHGKPYYVFYKLTRKETEDFVTARSAYLSAYRNFDSFGKQNDIIKRYPPGTRPEENTKASQELFDAYRKEVEPKQKAYDELVLRLEEKPNVWVTAKTKPPYKIDDIIEMDQMMADKARFGLSAFVMKRYGPQKQYEATWTPEGAGRG